jgi:uncharacterized protein YciI
MFKSAVRVLLMLLALAVAAPLAAQPVNMVKLYLVLLVPGPNAGMPPAEAAALMPQHLGHLESLVKSGKAVIAGPTAGTGRVAGIMALKAASPEEARQWAEADPAVKAGRFAVEVHAWWVEDGIMQPAFDPANLEQLYFGFLVRGPAWTPTSTPETQELQKQHLAYMEGQSKVGKLLIAGPCENAGDIRGIVVYRTATPEEARERASGDPMVKVGRLAVDLHTWFVSKGAFKQ